MSVAHEIMKDIVMHDWKMFDIKLNGGIIIGGIIFIILRIIHVKNNLINITLATQELN